MNESSKILRERERERDQPGYKEPQLAVDEREVKQPFLDTHEDTHAVRERESFSLWCM